MIFKIASNKFLLKKRIIPPPPSTPLLYMFFVVVKLYDYNLFGSDELIGQTIIDLEDRWFSRGWHGLERHDPVALEKRATCGPYKPLEVRDLSVPTSGNPQGQVEAIEPIRVEHP